MRSDVPECSCRRPEPRKTLLITLRVSLGSLRAAEDYAHQFDLGFDLGLPSMGSTRARAVGKVHEAQ